MGRRSHYLCHGPADSGHLKPLKRRRLQRMRSHLDTLLRTIPVAAALLVAPSISAQTLPDPVLAAGGVRWSATAEQSVWRQTYSTDASAGAPLDVERLAPGLADLRSALQNLINRPAGSALDLGIASAFVERTRRRIPLGVELGVFDWLTVGAELPLVQTNVFGAADLTGDSLALGVNPILEQRFQVLTFIAVIEERAAQAAQLASSACVDDPGGAACADASELANRLFAAVPLLRQAYGASAFFPSPLSPEGQGMLAWSESVQQELAALGLEAVGLELPLAATPLTGEQLDGLTGAGSPLTGTALDPRASLWRPGDLRLSASVRLLDLSLSSDSMGVPGVRLRLAGTGAVRLPTARLDSLDVYGEAGMSQGQTDLEAGLWAALTTRRLAVRAEASYTQQQSRVFDVSPSASRAALGDSLRSLRLTPGNVTRLSVEPAVRIAPALSVAAVWRWLSRSPGGVVDVTVAPAPLISGGEAALTLIPNMPRLPGFFPATGPLPHDSWTLQELGGSVTYRTTELGADRGFEAWLGIVHTFGTRPAGLPPRTRADMGLRLVRRLWGG